MAVNLNEGADMTHPPSLVMLAGWLADGMHTQRFSHIDSWQCHNEAKPAKVMPQRG
jgi:hypothetical protein